MDVGQSSGIIDWDEEIKETDFEDIDKYLNHLSNEEAGRAVHSWLENEFSDYRGLEFEQFCYDHERDFKGKFDAYDGHVTYEFKTKNGYALDAAPFDDDINQLNEYLNALDSELGVLVYISRDNLENVEQFLVLKEELN